jgi:subtilisin family serine protease
MTAFIHKLWRYMKNHLLIKLNKEIPEIKTPHWLDIIKDKSKAQDSILPDIDKLLSLYDLSVWVTREHKPAGVSWNNEEIESGLNRIYRLILKENTNIPRELIRSISLLPSVEYIKKGEVEVVDLPPGEYALASKVTGEESRKEIYLDEARQFTRGKKEIKVAVLDTGIMLDHPELTDSLLEGYDFVNIIDGAGKFFGDYLKEDADPTDEVGHGTHVAGIIAGKGVKMPEGIVPNCRIIPVRVLGALKRGNKLVGAGLLDNINNALKWAIDQGAEVINMSLGIRHTEGGLPHEEIVKYAKLKNVTIIAASGNDGMETLYYPGALPYVIAVGASDGNGTVAQFSTYGKQVDFVAPGTNIYSSYLNNDYAFSTGTSHASPFVAGAAAMLKSYALEKGYKLSDSQTKYILKHSADKTDTRFKNIRAGYGKVNLIDALKLLNYKLN